LIEPGDSVTHALCVGQRFFALFASALAKNDPAVLG